MGTRLTAVEQWLAGAANIHARGRTRFSRDLDGVQTWHDYAATTEHGALYTETVETRINGEAVPGQSTRAVTWITAEGQRVREESYALLNSGEWALTGSAVYEFDTQNRWVKRTAGNGRLTERELMCDGGLLWEIDENGIRTDYAYDTARQLVEVTRSAVMDGETVITPETITTYARDAAGRVLSTRQDTGAMTTQESTEYDLLGRMTSSTDVLGRVTTYAYSQDGLTVTQTVPSGATFITRSAPDGTVMEESGTGQRHVIYAIDLVSDGVRTFTKAVSGETQTELQRSIVNGAGETLRTGRPQHHRWRHLHEEHLQRQGAAHQNADGRGQCGHDDGPDPVGIRRLRQQNERNLETRRSGHGVQLAHHHVELRRGTGPE